jgi:poly(3-hydroxybutyrate) depolymerase
MMRTVFLLGCCGLMLACTGGAEVQDSDTDTETDSDTDEEKREGPAYSGGNAGLDCPSLTAGRNREFPSGDDTREFILELPSDPNGAPVVFAWHWLGGSADRILGYSTIGAFAEKYNAIVVAPESRGLTYEWDTFEEDDHSPDLVLFDDLLSCLWQQYEVDLDRVYATGMSAGGMWTVTLTHQRSEWLAASAPLSGGATSMSWNPEEAIPVLLTWGGVTDLYGSFSFHDSSLALSEQLTKNEQFVAHCVHSEGHTLPPGDEDYLWTFFESHPKGVNPEPWAEALPSSLPSFCSPKGE